MSSISALPADIVRWLSAQSDLSDITFLTEFPAIKKAVPLRKVIVAVGLHDVKLTDQFVDDGNGVLVRQEYCRSASMLIRLAIHVPFSRGGHTCHEVFSDVIDALNFASDLHIEESGCESITEDRDTDALVLKGYVRVTANFCPAASSNMNFQSFFDKTLLCGSHIRDASIHASAEEKYLWEHPLHVTRYTGTGSATRQFTLDFAPSWVMVFAMQCPPVLYNASQQCTELYSATASKFGCTEGIDLTGSDVVVSSRQGSFPGVTPYLNKVGYTYCLAAAR